MHPGLISMDMFFKKNNIINDSLKILSLTIGRFLQDLGPPNNQKNITEIKKNQNILI